MNVAVVQACSHLYTAIFEIQPDIVEYLLGIGVDLTQIGQVSSTEQQHYNVNVQLCVHLHASFALT